jgi:hypothetical protein
MRYTVKSGLKVSRVISDSVCPYVYSFYPTAKYPRWLSDQYFPFEVDKIDFWHPLIYLDDERRESKAIQTYSYLEDSLDDGLDYVRGYKGDR